MDVNTIFFNTKNVSLDCKYLTMSHKYVHYNVNCKLYLQNKMYNLFFIKIHKLKLQGIYIFTYCYYISYIIIN